MVSIRPDLNGFKIYVNGEPDVWLVFNGMRHLLASPDVAGNILVGGSNVKAVLTVDDIMQGPILNEGTCLVSAEGSGGVYLVTGMEPSIYRYPISDLETFEELCFDKTKIRYIPHLVLQGVPLGIPISRSSFREVIE